MSTRTIPRTRARVSNESDGDLGYLGCLYVDGERVYAAGGSYSHPTLLVSDDGAGTWRRLSHPPVSGLRSLCKVGDTLYLVGEYGLLAASVDSGLTWVNVPVDTQICLFDQVRAPDGTWWIVGDEGVILRSTDGIAYHRVEVGDWETRLLSIQLVGGVVHVLAFDGTIRKWDGSAMVPLSLEADSPLTGLAVTRTGTWVVIGDSGAIYRSTDGGTSFDEVDTDFGDDLEAILEIPQGLLVVGNDLVLFSGDDGQTWTEVPTDMSGHLWSIAKFGDTLLVGGDEGAIWTFDVSATETMEVSPDDDEDDDDDDEDEDDDDKDDDDDEEVVPATFATVEEASVRWIREGTAFSDGLNAYVRRVYAVGPNKAGNEPDETRQDMADYVREQLVALNAAGDHRRARQLFPPAYEPFDYESLGQGIDSVMYLRDGRRIARVGFDVYELGGDRIADIDDLDLFGQSFDRRFVVKGRDDRLDIHDGWDGPLLRSLPRGPAAGGATESIVVAPDGEAVLAATETGIFWITVAGAKRLLPDDESDGVSYPHAALSPNGRFVAMGTQDSSHIVIDRKTGRRYEYNTVSEYPHFAAFHADRPDVLLNSCHALYGSASLCVDLDKMIAGRKGAGRVLDRRAWVYSVGSAKFGYLLGDSGGYIWALDFAGEQQWYTFLGSTITAIDVSPDGKKLLVGSFAGIVTELDLTAKTPDPRLLTDGPVKDIGRWLFWQGHDPMIW